MFFHKFVCFFCFLMGAQALVAQSKPINTPYGNRVILHTKKEGVKMAAGQAGTINVNTYVIDSLVQSTRRDFGGAREIKIPTESDLAGKKMPAVLEALLYMTQGDSATVFQPVDSAMAKAIKPMFGDVKEIRYELTLEEIITAEIMLKREEEAKKMMEAQAKATAEGKTRGAAVATTVNTTLSEYKDKKLGQKLKKTSSGLEYVILEQGTGAPIKDGDEISTHYYGCLKANGNKFDTSFDQGAPIPFGVGQLVPGFNEGMKLLNRGGKAILFIPSALGYGDQGAGDVIPPNSDLVFYIEMGL